MGRVDAVWGDGGRESSDLKDSDTLLVIKGESSSTTHEQAFT